MFLGVSVWLVVERDGEEERVSLGDPLEVCRRIAAKVRRKLGAEYQVRLSVEESAHLLRDPQRNSEPVSRV